MARKNYTDEQKAAVLARVEAVGIVAASKEAGIDRKTVATWKKAAETAKIAETQDVVDQVETEAVVEATAAAETEAQPAEAPATEALAEAETEAQPAEADAVMEEMKAEPKQPETKPKQARPKQQKAKARKTEPKQAKQKKMETKTVAADQNVKGENKMSEKKNTSKDSKAGFPGKMPFRPDREWFEKKKDSASKSKDEFKENMKSFWEKKIEMEKSSVEASKEQWTKSFDYLKDMQETLVSSLPDDSNLPIPPKDFMKEMKKFQEMSKTHFIEQADSVVDFYFKSQEQLLDVVYTAMSKKKEEK